jgi:hypothetical protein
MKIRTKMTVSVTDACKIVRLTFGMCTSLDCIYILTTTATVDISGFGGLGVACWPLVPKFEGSNPAEALGFFRVKKSPARLPSEGK